MFACVFLMGSAGVRARLPHTSRVSADFVSQDSALPPPLPPRRLTFDLAFGGQFAAVAAASHYVPSLFFSPLPPEVTFAAWREDGRTEEAGQGSGGGG